MGKILIMDEIEALPGKSAELRKLYEDDYMPGAKARGMTLESSWRAPVADFGDRPVTFFFTWSVADVPGWWAMRVGEDHEKKVWWNSISHLISNRRRLFLTAELEGMAA